MGCVVSSETAPPPPSSAFFIMASLASSCSLRDCVVVGSDESSMGLPFWCVDNCLGTFLATDPSSGMVTGGAYDFCNVLFGISESSQEVSKKTPSLASTTNEPCPSQFAHLNSDRRFEAVTSFTLVWWNQGSSSRKKLSIWHPIVPPGMVYFGDIAVQGYEPPNACVVAEDLSDEVLKEPIDFNMVGKIKKK